MSAETIWDTVEMMQSGEKVYFIIVDGEVNGYCVNLDDAILSMQELACKMKDDIPADSNYNVWSSVNERNVKIYRQSLGYVYNGSVEELHVVEIKEVSKLCD